MPKYWFHEFFHGGTFASMPSDSAVVNCDMASHPRSESEASGEGHEPAAPGLMCNPFTLILNTRLSAERPEILGENNHARSWV
jgi:hypothetical protein